MLTKTRDNHTGSTWVGREYVLGRLRLRVVVFQHKYPGSGSPDRWVVQPSFIYDRKDRR